MVYKKSNKISKYVAIILGLVMVLMMMCGCSEKGTQDANGNGSSEILESYLKDETEAGEESTEATEATDASDVAAENSSTMNEVAETEEIAVNSDASGDVDSNNGSSNDVAEEIHVMPIEDQIRVFIDNKDVWYLEESEKDNSKIYYLVTDLDLNERIEIIRCDYCCLPEFCQNRFYEISADYKTVEKMDYDVETMWANGEENGASHGIATAQLPIDCFWNKAGNRMTYFYIIPTREHEDGVETITQMSLGVNNTGKVFTDFAGYANLNTETGEITYTDYNGFECTQEEFERAGFISYSVESGWKCDSVTWQTVMLDETTDMFETLLESYNAYAHNPVDREY